MDENQIRASLAGLPLGGIRYHPCVSSTNDVAAQWVIEGAPDLALVIADEQTTGRGRDGRAWYTPAGSALAISLVIYPTETIPYIQSRLTALGALAVHNVLHKHYNLPASIKWPNDVLVNRLKLAGVLAEAHWSGEVLKAVILGVGLNVTPHSVREAERLGGSLIFPASCVESAVGHAVDRLELLRQVVQELLYWRPRIGSFEFLQAWEANLAFRGEVVQVSIGGSAGKDGLPLDLENRAPSIEEGLILGLSPDGSLRLRKENGEIVNVHFGEVRLRSLHKS
ncbi:MAG: biotin--[acetyl-CoA-carboxylase] ligase [Anaerolineales bacterium]|jgi:BirA family biotin operon repressor/biotin-[acetyl-CoA-carboxylase] ligase|nr:biotin--[acetyl-CoA-carboxylase] ligase [Anaerolineales bacterium]